MRAELPQVGDPRERVALLLEIGTIEEMVKGDRNAARKALEEAREIDPAHAGVLDALAEIYYASAEWDRLVNVLQSMADATLDVIHRSMLRHALGLIQDVAIKNPAAARAAYKLALVDDPSNLAAAVSLESLALVQEDWGELARTLVVEAELVGEARTVRRLCERAGDLYWERLAQGENAITAYRKAARVTPDELAPLRKLSAVLESIGRWRELVEVYLLELPLVRDPEERGDLFFRIGEVHESFLGHADDAVTAWQQALETVPTHLPTLQALGALYRTSERWPELVQMDLREAEKISDPKRRAGCYFEVAQLVERRIGDETEAARLYQRSFDLDPIQGGAFDALDRLYRREERWADVVKLYERQAETTKDRSLVRHYKLEAARLWRERVPNIDKSQAAFREALAVDAPDLAPLLLLANVLETAQRWEPLTVSLEQLATLLDGEDLIGTLHRLARVLELELSQDDRALAVHERVLARSPENETSQRAVGRLHHRAGRWEQVISCYTRQLEHCQNADERAAIHYRIGRIDERKLGRRDEAIAAYDRSLAESRRYTPAFRALDRILRRDHRWPRLLEVLLPQVDAERTPAGKAHLYHAIGEIQELHLRDLPAAEKAYTMAVKLQPGYEAAAAALAQVSEARRDWKALDAHYCELLQHTAEPNARVSVLIRIGLLSEFRLEDPGRAALFYQDAIEAAPLGRVLLQAELRAARRDAGPQATVRSLQRLGARTSDARLKHGYQLLAALRDEVAARTPNAALFLEAASLQRGDPGVADGLIRALSREIIPDAPNQHLADALVERAQSCGSASARALLLLEAGLLYERLGDARDAAIAYESAGRGAPDFLPVLRGIRRIAMVSEEWPGVVALLKREAEVATHPENRAAALLAAGEIAVGRLNDAPTALGMYRRLLELQPDHERAYLRATALLERLSDHQGLFDLLVARTSATKDPEGRAVLLRRQAELQRDHLGDPQGAVATLKQAIALQPEDVEPFLALAPLQEAQGWWQDAADSWRQIAELSAGSDTSRAARLREAGLREKQLGDREAARSILEELVVDPNDREAARYMAQLCERMGRWDRARDLYAQLAQTTKSTAERAGCLISLAGVLESGFGDHTGGARAVDEAFVLALGDAEVVALLEQRFGEMGDWRNYAAAGERAFAKARVVAAPHATLRLSLARVYADELRRSDLAARQLSAAAELVPTDPTPLVRLARMHLDANHVEPALQHFRRALAIDPFHPGALRGLGTALMKSSVPDAVQLLDEVATLVDGGRVASQALGPRTVWRPMPFEELQGLVARTAGGRTAAVGELVRLFEPHAAALLVEATGRIPRGDELPEANGVSLKCRAIAQALGVDPLRVFVDPPDGTEARLVADARLALCIGKELTRSTSQGLLVHEVARQLWFVANRATLGAFAGAAELTTMLQAIVIEDVPDALKDLRRRLLKPIPRRVRKDAERIVAESIPDLGREVAAWHAEEMRWAERIALLLSREPAAVLRAICGPDPKALPRNARATDLVRWLASEDCWNLYLRLLP